MHCDLPSCHGDVAHAQKRDAQRHPQKPHKSAVTKTTISCEKSDFSLGKKIFLN